MSNNWCGVATVSLDLSQTGLTGSIAGSLGGLDRLSESDMLALFECGVMAPLFSQHTNTPFLSRICFLVSVIESCE